jgi:hypothetical protein
LEAGDLAWEATEHGFIGAQQLANRFGTTSYVIQDIGKLKLLKGITFKAAGNVLGAASLVITAVDIYKNNLNWSNGTDLVMGTVALVPGVGWVISGSYFLINGIVEEMTGKSLGEHFGDALKLPAVQSAYQSWPVMPNF